MNSQKHKQNVLFGSLDQLAHTNLVLVTSDARNVTVATG